MTDPFTGQWIGHIRGSEIGDVYAVITDGQPGPAVRLTVNVRGAATTFAGHLDVSGEKPRALLKAELLEADALTAQIRFDRYSGTGLAGEWILSTSHAGIIFMDRADTAPKTGAEQQAGPLAPPEKPVELRSRQSSLPSLTLFRPELEALVALLKELIGGSNDVVIAANIGGTEIRQFAKDFFARETLPPFVSRISLSLADGRQPLQNTITASTGARRSSASRSSEASGRAAGPRRTASQ